MLALNDKECDALGRILLGMEGGGKKAIKDRPVNFIRFFGVSRLSGLGLGTPQSKVTSDSLHPRNSESCRGTSSVLDHQDFRFEIHFRLWTRESRPDGGSRPSGDIVLHVEFGFAGFE